MAGSVAKYSPEPIGCRAGSSLNREIGSGHGTVSPEFGARLTWNLNL